MRLKLFLPLLTVLTAILSGNANAAKPAIYEIRIYHIMDKKQEATVEHYLKNALLPALDRIGIRDVGVFTPVVNDTVAGRRIYVFIPFRSVKEFTGISRRLEKDREYLSAGTAYFNAPFDQVPYRRMETILLEAFSHMPQPKVPQLDNDRQTRVYELRSYEAPTEKLFANKVHMFNEGGEVALFDRLGFNAVFYGSVLSGSRMPNLMYMTTHESMEAREKNWKAFGSDPEWKKLSAMDYYKNNVSKIDIVFLRATEYSRI
jgi:hypothetical protein